MRALVWMFGLAVFLLCTVAAYILFPFPRTPIFAERSARKIDSRGDGEGRLPALRGSLFDAFGQLERAVRRELGELERAVSDLETETLRELLRRLEMERDVKGDLLTELRRVLDDPLDGGPLEFLVLVTIDGTVVLAHGGSGAVEEVSSGSGFKRRLVQAGERIFRDPGRRPDFEVLSGETARSSEDEQDSEAPRLFQVVARPIWVRPDLPYAVLMGGRSLDRTMARLAGFLKGQPELRWHAFSGVPGDSPAVFAGAEKGEPVRQALVADLEERARSEEPAFQRVEPQMGRWGAVLSDAGDLVIGYGVTATSGAVRAALSAPVPKAGVVGDGPRYGLLLVTGAVLLGFLVLGGALWLWSHRASSANFIQSEWDSLVRVMREEVDNAHALGEKLLSDLEATRETDEALRAELEEIRRRERALRQRLEREADGKGAEASAVEEKVLGEELKDLRLQIAGMRDFQSALIQGNLPAPLVAVDPEYKIFVWNPAMEKLLRRPAGQLLGRRLPEVTVASPALQERILTELRRAMDTGEPRATSSCAFPLEGADEIRVRIYCEPIAGEGGKILGAIGSVENLTELAESRNQCELQDLFQECLTQSIPMALIITDSEKRVISWNRRAEALLGVSEEHALGEDLLALDSRLGGEGFRDAFARAENRGEPCRFCLRLGEERDGEDAVVALSPLRLAAGEVRGYLLLLERARAQDPVDVQQSA